MATMSLSSIRANPCIEDPSNPLPSSKAPSNSSEVIEKLLRKPKMSENQSLMNFTL